ncbi:MAG: ATPase, partial [Prevotella sp.]|nr:ATPase [Prevotella sp.]MDD6993771.1 ATPase [Prevotella sp.]
ISQHINEIGWIEDMIVDCFRLFFRRNVSHYNRPDLPVCFVGSIAFYYKKQLEKAATLEGYSIGKVLKAPL